MKEHKLSEAEEIISELNSALDLHEATPILKKAINFYMRTKGIEQAKVHNAVIRCSNRFEIPLA